MPTVAPDGPLDKDQKGLLSPLGDPLGRALNTGLKPVGHFTGQIGKPSGEALHEVRRQAAEETGLSQGGKKEEGEEEDKRKDSAKPGGERIGGKEPTAENPLGL